MLGSISIMKMQKVHTHQEFIILSEIIGIINYFRADW